MTYSILITCINMINTIDKLKDRFIKNNLEFHIPDTEGKQQLTEKELIELVPQFEGWIAGDDPITRRVLKAGKMGKLKALVKWGIGVDSIDRKACADLDIHFSNTPGVFGDEVADSALSYLLCMCRQIHKIDQRVREGVWYKPLGITLRGKKALVIGFGSIGQQISVRLQAFGVQTTIKDPYYDPSSCEQKDIYVVDDFSTLPLYDFVILCCPLVSDTYHLVSKKFLQKMKKEAILINVARGPIVDTDAIVEALENKEIAGYATDVYEVEPLPIDSRLRLYDDRTMFGSHNSSNTQEGVQRTNNAAIELIVQFLG